MQQRQRELVVEELSKNGFDHVRIDGHGGQLGGAVREEDMRQFFEGFKVDKVRDMLFDLKHNYLSINNGLAR